MSKTPLLETRDFPEIPKELLEQLNLRFPLRPVRPNEGLADAHRIAGARDVVAFLESVYARQQETPSVHRQQRDARPNQSTRVPTAAPGPTVQVGVGQPGGNGQTGPSIGQSGP